MNKRILFIFAALFAGSPCNAQNVKAVDNKSEYKPNYKELKFAPKHKTKVATSCTCRKKVTKVITTRYVTHKSLPKASDK